MELSIKLKLSKYYKVSYNISLLFLFLVALSGIIIFCGVTVSHVTESIYLGYGASLAVIGILFHLRFKILDSFPSKNGKEVFLMEMKESIFDKRNTLEFDYRTNRALLELLSREEFDSTKNTYLETYRKQLETEILLQQEKNLSEFDQNTTKNLAFLFEKMGRQDDANAIREKIEQTFI